MVLRPVMRWGRPALKPACQGLLLRICSMMFNSANASRARAMTRGPTSTGRNPIEPTRGGGVACGADPAAPYRKGDAGEY
jgi:hypothetical protein